MRQWIFQILGKTRDRQTAEALCTVMTHEPYPYCIGRWRGGGAPKKIAILLQRW